MAIISHDQPKFKVKVMINGKPAVINLWYNDLCRLYGCLERGESPM